MYKCREQDGSSECWKYMPRSELQTFLSTNNEVELVVLGIIVTLPTSDAILSKDDCDLLQAVHDEFPEVFMY